MWTCEPIMGVSSTPKAAHEFFLITCGVMLRSLVRLSTPVTRLSGQLLSNSLPSLSTRIFTRLFSEEANGTEEPVQEEPAEEIAQPLAHNKFAHVITCIW